MLQKLKKSRTVDAARKIAVFKTIQRQVGLRGLPSIPDVTCFSLLFFPDENNPLLFLSQANTTLPSMNFGITSSRHFQMELFKRQQAILSDLKKSERAAPVEPLPVSTAVNANDILLFLLVLETECNSNGETWILSIRSTFCVSLLLSLFLINSHDNIVSKQDQGVILGMISTTILYRIEVSDSGKLEYYNTTNYPFIRTFFFGFTGCH